MQDNRFTWMHAGQVGAPQMTGEKLSEGQILKVLDAGLVNGFNPQNASTVQGTTSTVTLKYMGAHGYELRQLITVSGATDAKLNGRHRIIEKTSDTITIDAKDVSTLTGTITTKISPLGFESMFGDTEPLKRAYRSANLQGTRTVLYLDASLPIGHGYNSANPAKRVMVDLCEDMTTLGTQINSYTSTFNNRPAVRNGQMFWYQARGYEKNVAVNDAVQNNWVIIGNGDFFYLFNDWSRNSVGIVKHRDWYAFGDVPSFYSDDKFNCFWAGLINKNDITPMYWAANSATLGGDPNLLEYSGRTPYAVGFFIKPKNGIGSLQSVSLSLGALEEYTLASGSSFNITLVDNLEADTLIALPTYLSAKNLLRAQALKLLALPYSLGNNLGFDLSVSGDYLFVALSVDGHQDNEWGYFAFDLGD